MMPDTGVRGGWGPSHILSLQSGMGSSHITGEGVSEESVGSVCDTLQDDDSGCWAEVAVSVLLVTRTSVKKK